METTLNQDLFGQVATFRGMQRLFTVGHAE
jgi:hypothetical protein